MGRRPRIEFNGAIYHVIQRGNNKEYIFEKDEDKNFLLRDIIKKQRDLYFKIIGYAIMNSHFHFIIQTAEEPLQNIMHRINNRYSKHYNHKYDRKGHVFDNRYRAILVQNENYLLTLLRYIHQNPVKAGICSRVDEYKWSSDCHYRKGHSEEIDVKTVLDSISKDRNAALKHYNEFMLTMDDKDYSKGYWIGEEEAEPLAVPIVEAGERKSLDEILVETGISPEDYIHIKAGSRRRSLTAHKAEYAKRSLEYNYTLKEIGKHIKLSAVAVHRLINR